MDAWRSFASRSACARAAEAAADADAAAAEAVAAVAWSARFWSRLCSHACQSSTVAPPMPESSNGVTSRTIPTHVILSEARAIATVSRSSARFRPVRSFSSSTGEVSLAGSSRMSRSSALAVSRSSGMGSQDRVPAGHYQSPNVRRDFAWTLVECIPRSSQGIDTECRAGLLFQSISKPAARGSCGSIAQSEPAAEQPPWQSQDAPVFLEPRPAPLGLHGPGAEASRARRSDRPTTTRRSR
jgi:hypothetical protein